MDVVRECRKQSTGLLPTWLPRLAWSNSPIVDNKYPPGCYRKRFFLYNFPQVVDKGFNVTASFIEGNIHESLIEYKETHDIGIIVMGAFGHSKLRQFFLGSNTLKMLERSKVPLVVLK